MAYDKVDKTQKQFDKNIEDDITSSIKADLDTEKPDENEEPEAKSGKDEGEDVKKSKKNVDKKKKSSDNNNDDSPDPQKQYDTIVNKILQEELDGDESKIGEARTIANIAIKTFDGDPIKAAKSYRKLYREQSQIKGLIGNNPFLERLINEAKQGKTIDENYAKSVLGTATSDKAEQPTSSKQDTGDEHEQLDLDDFDPDDITADELIKAGVINQAQYENADAVDRKEMVQKGRLTYAMKVLPGKIAEQSVQLSQKKKQEQAQKEKKQKAIDTNKDRVRQGVQNVVSQYDVDFEGNPEHAQLWDEIRQKAYKIPDLDDDSNMLISENAVEQATRHVFQKHGLDLRKVDIDTDTDTDTDTGSEHKQHRMIAGSQDAMERILSDVQGFQGTASKKSSEMDKEDKDQPSGNSLDDQVKQKVNQHMTRGRKTSHMISNVRKTDRKKPE